MKQTILLLLFAAIACTDDNETSYSVTPELQGYVESFYQEGALRGKDLPKNNLIASLNSECQTITQIKKDDDQWILEFDTEAFSTMTDNKKESFIFHELGRIVLKRELSKEFSIMNGDVKVNGYSADQREALLDELFK